MVTFVCYYKGLLGNPWRFCTVISINIFARRSAVWTTYVYHENGFPTRKLKCVVWLTRTKSPITVCKRLYVQLWKESIWCQVNQNVGPKLPLHSNRWFGFCYSHKTGWAFSCGSNFFNIHSIPCYSVEWDTTVYIITLLQGQEKKKQNCFSQTTRHWNTA